MFRLRCDKKLPFDENEKSVIAQTELIQAKNKNKKMNRKDCFHLFRFQLTNK